MYNIKKQIPKVTRLWDISYNIKKKLGTSEGSDKSIRLRVFLFEISSIATGKNVIKSGNTPKNSNKSNNFQSG